MMDSRIGSDSSVSRWLVQKKRCGKAMPQDFGIPHSTLTLANLEGKQSLCRAYGVCFNQP